MDILLFPDGLTMLCLQSTVFRLFLLSIADIGRSFNEGFLFILLLLPSFSLNIVLYPKQNKPIILRSEKGADMKLGDLLSMLRKEKCFLQKDVADYLNLSVATVSNYEKNVRMPDLETLVKLADFYDVSTDYLLQRTRCRAGIRTLGRRLSADFTVGDLINTTLHLDRNSIRFLLECCDLLSLRSRVENIR